MTMVFLLVAAIVVDVLMLKEWLLCYVNAVGVDKVVV